MIYFECHYPLWPPDAPDEKKLIYAALVTGMVSEVISKQSPSSETKIHQVKQAQLGVPIHFRWQDDEIPQVSILWTNDPDLAAGSALTIKDGSEYFARELTLNQSIFRVIASTRNLLSFSSELAAEAWVPSENGGPGSSFMVIPDQEKRTITVTYLSKGKLYTKQQNDPFSIPFSGEEYIEELASPATLPILIPMDEVKTNRYLGMYETDEDGKLAYFHQLDLSTYVLEKTDSSTDTSSDTSSDKSSDTSSETP